MSMGLTKQAMSGDLPPCILPCRWEDLNLVLKEVHAAMLEGSKTKVGELGP